MANRDILPKFEATLYLWGEQIELEKVSQLLGASPSTSWHKGDPIVRDMTLKGYRKHGQWISPALTSVDEQSIEDVIEKILTEFPPPNGSYIASAGVDAASIGVLGLDANSKDDIDWHFSNRLLTRVAKAGCSLQIAVSH